MQKSELQVRQGSTEKLFDDISSDYDRLNHLLSLGVDRIWRRRALKEIVTPDAPQQILDVACGTGDFSIAIAQKVHSGSTITGLDLSEGMLAVMDQKVAAKGLSSIVTAIKGNGEQMPFPDQSFDHVTIAFGIRNFAHREEALREMYRVLQSGGSLVILELSLPENAFLRWVYNLYFSHLLPVIGGLVSGNIDAYRYLCRSVKAFPDKERWMDIMRRCGFSSVRQKSLTLGICRLYVGKKM